MGLSGTAEDSIDMAISVRELSIKSIPVNMLTTAGITTKTDIELLNELEYEAKICNE